MAWHQLRYQETGAIRQVIVEQEGAPASKSLALAALRGVLKEAWKLGLTTAEQRERLYVSADRHFSEHHTLAEAARRVPGGIVCLLSALRYHDLTTQAPFEVWMAIDVRARQPRVDHPSLRIVRFSGEALEFGVEEHQVDSVAVRIYSPAKTIADCFKFRNKIGLDVALEALRDAWSKRVVTTDDLWRAAAATRMKNVMRPYLESIA